MKKLLVVASLALLLVGCGKPGDDVVGKYILVADIRTAADPARRTEVEFLKDGSGNISTCCTIGGNRFTVTFTWSIPDNGRMRTNVTLADGNKEEAIGSYKVLSNGNLELTDLGRAMTGTYMRRKN